MENSPDPGMPSITVSINGIKQLLQKLKPKKATGPDMVPTWGLEDYADEIFPIFQKIFQQSQDTGQVLDNWKELMLQWSSGKGSVTLQLTTGQSLGYVLAARF